MPRLRIDPDRYPPIDPGVLVRAAAGLFWFMSGPMIVTAKVEPLKPSAGLPTFKRIER